MSFSRAGRGAPERTRGSFRWLLIAAILVANLWLAGGAGGASGGAGVPRPSPPTKKRPPARPQGKASSRAPGTPLGSRGMWIWYVSASSGGSPASIIQAARTYGLSTLIIKAGDGPTAWSQFNSPLVALFHVAGLRVCAWQYVYGNHPVWEAEVGAAAVHAGADCLLIDAESEYQGKYIQAQEYMKKLRSLIGSRYPIALAGFPYIDYHPGFPYSVFLGPGGAQYNAPQMYWVDIGTSVDNVYAHTYAFNIPFQRPIEPLGEVAGNPPPGQVLRFRQLSRAYGASGVSWWDWQGSSPRDWWGISHSIGNLSGITTDVTLPLLTPRGGGGIWAGDLVVWAQEHLIRAGQPVAIDGDFGPLTQTAVDQFQSTHGLSVTGVVDPATWQSLLSYKAPTVTWVKQQGKTIAQASRAHLRLSVPWSAHLPARRYEIPRDLGAGPRPPR